MYYVVCPYGLVTGGPDALHQMVYYLNFVGKQSTLIYLFVNNYDSPIPNPYRDYIQEYKIIDDIVDIEQNVVIIPEYISNLQKKIKYARVYIWWLSVDYNLNKTSIFFKFFLFATYLPRLLKNRSLGIKKFNRQFFMTLIKSKHNFKKEKNNVNHLCASYYAYDYVQNRNCFDKPIKLCIEPLSKVFLSNMSKKDGDRSDVVLYNPKKSERYVDFLRKRTDIVFLPLVGFSQSELIKKYSTSKLYIDFGPFPGAERMPKEAVLNGCAVITGTHGASKYYGDVSIPDEYKFSDEYGQYQKVLDKIKYILNHYYEVIEQFEDYKNNILSLEQKFIDAVKDI